MNRTQLICLRHAEAEPLVWESSRGTAIGCGPPDPPLTQRGRRQALTVARGLLERKAKKVFVSKALRARETGNIIASILDVQIEVVPALAEISMGSGDSEPRRPGLAGEVLRQWIVCGNHDVRLLDGETGHEVAERMKNTLNDIGARHRGDLVIVVGHVASLTVGVSALCQNGPELWGKPLCHATPFRLSITSEGWQVQWPDSSERIPARDET